MRHCQRIPNLINFRASPSRMDSKRKQKLVEMVHCRGVLQQGVGNSRTLYQTLLGRVLASALLFRIHWLFAVSTRHACARCGPALQGQRSCRCRMANIVKNMKQDFVVQKSFQMTEDTIRNDFSWYKNKPFQMTAILKRFKTVSSIKKNIKKKMWKQNRHQA